MKRLLFVLLPLLAFASASRGAPVRSELAPPGDLENSGITATSFTANWRAVDGATSYLLDVATFGFDEQEPDDPDDPGSGFHEKEPDVLSAQPVDGTSYTVGGLDCATYYWRVRAVGNGLGPFSETEEVTLVADPTAPPRFGAIGDIEIFLGETARVRVRVSAPEEAPVTSLEIVEGDSSAALEDGWFSFTPTAEGDYDFTIVAVNANGAASVGFAVTVGPAPPRKFAVCVGINEYESIGSLRGCVNDAEFMAANLIVRGGWDAADVAVLLDSAATKAAIRGAISNVVAQAKAGDTFVYQHSSHGGRSNGGDGKDTFLCVYDKDLFDDTTAYNDYEIAADLAAFPSGVKVVAIVNACHSGGLFKGRAAPADFDLAARVSAILESGRTRDRGRGAAGPISASEIGWAVAADYDEKSLDGVFYHTDTWMAGLSYGDEYWDVVAKVFRYPSFYRTGSVFPVSATWGWWDGSADADDEVGDGDGLCDAYEFWKSGYDLCVRIGDLAGNPSLDFHPQCTNVAVLRSVELGWSGPSAEPFPTVASGASPEDLAALVAGSADVALVAHVRDKATYDAFRAWAASAKDAAGAAPAGLAAVRASPWSWLAFAIGSDRLLEVGEDDLSIASFSLDPATGAFALEAGIDGAAVSDAADPARLAETFVLQGSPALDGKDAYFSAIGIDVESVAPTNGGVRFVAGPPDDAPSFFLRVHVVE